MQLRVLHERYKSSVNPGRSPAADNFAARYALKCDLRSCTSTTWFTVTAAFLIKTEGRTQRVLYTSAPPLDRVVNALTRKPGNSAYSVQCTVYSDVRFAPIKSSFINNKRANWPLTLLYKNIKSTIKHSDTQWRVRRVSDQGLLRRGWWRQTASNFSQGGGNFLHLGGFKTFLFGKHYGIFLEQ